ncbi:MAG TPA: ATP-dependent helicase [Candidatus Nanoarchaeia archaeon]|nr:ATP-dependent helicase [Candidatus Nanoarchaeia archaeon]
MITYKQQPNTDEEIFTILNPLVKRWFQTKFKTFGLPQRYAVLDIHSRTNILVSAPTGSGKTLTAFLSVLNELIDNAEKGILEDKTYCIYVSPLKALNSDIRHNLITPLKEMEELAQKKLGIRVGLRTGDTTAKEKAAMLKKAPHILITTPESLAIMLNSPKFVEYLKNVQWCIVDEIHALAENKRGVHLSLSLERLQRIAGYCTRVGLSATVAPLDEIAQFLVGFNTDGTPRDCTIVDVRFLKPMDFKVVSPLKNLVDTDACKASNALYETMHDLIQQHKTTVIFTNTRSATERVVHHFKERYPQFYNDNIGAHHSSLGKEMRHNLEDRLRKGELKVVVCSTSLELGIDIGYIDLVICLGSPKSVARFLQRAGRAGHKVHDTVKSRIIVLDRDDLVECSLLLKSALEKKIDRVHIPMNCLDVLAQQLYGMAIEEPWNLQTMFAFVKQSYNYHTLTLRDFQALINYLSGAHVSLEDRHVYAKIWWDKEKDMVGKRGKLARVIYMTNIGTIPEETAVRVKLQGSDVVIGMIDEGFVERLKPNDTFVLGGEVYQYKFSRGMVATVSAAASKVPTVPSWVSEMLPLSFDLANDIGKFRRLMNERFESGAEKADVLMFIHNYLYVDENAAESIYHYFWEQYHFMGVPSDKKLIIEYYKDYENNEKTYAVFHTLFGRRVNDCLSRAIAFAIGKQQGRDVEVGINDNGFYVSYDGAVNVLKAFKALDPKMLRAITEQSIDKSEVLKRRFRHCACRSLMILREYKGYSKTVGRQQVSSKILMEAVKRIDMQFPILKEARREVLDDVMDFVNAQRVLEGIEKKDILVVEQYTQLPSPFAFNLVSQGFSDIIKIEDKYDFLRRMHQMILAKIGKKELSTAEIIG